MNFLKSILNTATYYALHFAAYCVQVVNGCNGGFNSCAADRLHANWFGK